MSNIKGYSIGMVNIGVQDVGGGQVRVFYSNRRGFEMVCDGAADLDLRVHYVVVPREFWMFVIEPLIVFRDAIEKIRMEAYASPDAADVVDAIYHRFNKVMGAISRAWSEVR